MAVVARRTWQERDRRIADPEAVKAVLRSNLFSAGQFVTYLDGLAERGVALPHLGAMARNSFLFVSREEHLRRRRQVAPFFSAAAVDRRRPQIRAALAAALEGLAASPEPDLVRDFVQPAFLRIMETLIGFAIDDDAEVAAAVVVANRVSEPLQSLSDLRRIDAAMGTLAARLSRSPRPPGSLLAALAPDLAPGESALDPDGMAVNVALSMLVAAQSMVQTLAFALEGLLLQPLEVWRRAAAPDWTATQLDRLLSLYLSTLTLARVAEGGTEIGGCPVQAGQTVVLDMVGANEALRCPHVDGAAHLSFGTGPHKCPGEQLARAFVGEAVPMLARRFPRLALHRDRIGQAVTAIVQYPTALPCVLDADNRRLNGRLIEIRAEADAQRIVNDDGAWAPPPMVEHLRELQARGGGDLGVAIRIARNAPFFLSGRRHAEARRAVAAHLGENRLTRWQTQIERRARRAVEALAEAPQADLIAGFVDPFFRATVQPILGIQTSDPARFDALAPKIQAVIDPLLPLRELLGVQETLAELLDLMQVPPLPETGPAPLLSALVRSPPPAFDREDLKALVLILYGASFNVRHSLANLLHHLLTLPPEDRRRAGEQDWIDGRLESLIALSAAPKYIYRVAREDLELGGFSVARNTTARLQLLSINREARVGNLAFGHGLHRCFGAALSKRLLRSAVPPLFARFPGLRIDPRRHRYFDLSQTAALEYLPCRLPLK